MKPPDRATLDAALTRYDAAVERLLTVDPRDSAAAGTTITAVRDVCREAEMARFNYQWQRSEWRRVMSRPKSRRRWTR